MSTATKEAQENKGGMSAGKAAAIGGTLAALFAGVLILPKVFAKKTPEPVQEPEKPASNTSQKVISSGSQSSAPVALPSGTFPIAKGQRSKLVQNIQNALIARGDTASSLIKKSGGADGVYGSGTADALTYAGFPLSIDQATYDKIINPTASTSIKSSLLPPDPRMEIVKAEATKDINKVVTALQLLKNTNDYTNAQYNLVGSNGLYFQGETVKKTIVTKLLEDFPNNPERGMLEKEFFRIGLAKSANGTWAIPSISGLGEVQLGAKVITINPTIVYDKSGSIGQVTSENMTIGREIDRDIVNNMSIVQTIDGKIAKVSVEDVVYKY